MRGGAGQRRYSRASNADQAAGQYPFDLSSISLAAAGRRDSDASSLASSRLSSAGFPSAISLPHLSDRNSQSAALRYVNAYLSSHSTSFSLRPPLPSARDINSALNFLLSRLHFPIPSSTNSKALTLEDDLLLLLRILHCPFKLTRSALKAPGTPHSWPPLLSVLHWLCQLACLSDHIEQNANPTTNSSSNDLILYLTQSYLLFLSGDDDAVADLDDEYLSKARSHAAAAAAAADAIEKEAEDLESRYRIITSGPSRREAIENEKALLMEDCKKFGSVVESWKSQVSGMEESLSEWERELEAKEKEAMRIAAENDELKKKVDAQAMNVRDAERMRREMIAVEKDIADADNGKAIMEEKAWELEAATVKKCEEIEMLAEQCQQAIKKLKLGVEFQYLLNEKGSSAAEVIGLNYKSVLKPAIHSLAEDAKKLSLSKIEESVVLQEQSREKAKILEGKQELIAALQMEIYEIDAKIAAVKNEMEDHSAKCSREMDQLKEEFQREEHELNTVEKEAQEVLKNSQQKLQDAKRESHEEMEMCACELLASIDAITEYKEFIETTLAGTKTDLSETADVVASVSAKLASGVFDYCPGPKRARRIDIVR